MLLFKGFLYYVRVILPVLNHPPPFVMTFSLPKVRQKLPFFAPNPMFAHNLKMVPIMRMILSNYRVFSENTGNSLSKKLQLLSNNPKYGNIYNSTFFSIKIPFLSILKFSIKTEHWSLNHFLTFALFYYLDSIKKIFLVHFN